MESGSLQEQYMFLTLSHLSIPRGFKKLNFLAFLHLVTPSYDRILDNIIVSVLLIPVKSLTVYFNIFET